MPRDLRVCFVGDSFVAGVGDPEHLGWAGRVAARTHRSGQPLTAYVLGVRRETSGELAGRWRAECVPRLPEGCDGRVVLSTGVNDTTVEDGVRRVPAAASAQHLEDVLRGVQEAGWSALVVGPPPVADPEQDERTAALEAGFSAVCRAAGVGCVRVVDRLATDPVWVREVAAGDGAHPGAGGYARLADLVWPQWQAWIDQPAPEGTTGTAPGSTAGPSARASRGTGSAGDWCAGASNGCVDAQVTVLGRRLDQDEPDLARPATGDAAR